MPTPFRAAMEDLIRTVFGPLGPQDGIGGDEVACGGGRLGVRLPAVLREHYALAGRHRQVMDGMNHVLGPGDLYVANGGVVFEEESQHYYFSAILLDHATGDDPPVVQGNRGEDRWYPESRRLSDYLLALTCWQACNALPALAGAKVSPGQLARMAAGLRRASFGVDAGDDTVGLWGGGVAAAAFTRTNDVYLAARSDDAIDAFAARFGLDLSDP